MYLCILWIFKMEETFHNLEDKRTCSLDVGQPPLLVTPELAPWIHKLNGLDDMDFPLPRCLNVLTAITVARVPAKWLTFSHMHLGTATHLGAGWWHHKVVVIWPQWNRHLFWFWFISPAHHVSGSTTDQGLLSALHSSGISYLPIMLI